METRQDVQQILDYKIENSCDEKLLKLMANRTEEPSPKEQQLLNAKVKKTLPGTFSPY